MQPLPEWASYRVDRKGTRLPKSVPPPQGTYKTNEGIGKTDYYFYAPTAIEQQMVWQALRPTRESFHVLTTTNLKIEKMRGLSLGYNASWDEIRRKFVNGMVSDPIVNPVSPSHSDPAVVADPRRPYGPLSDYWRYPPGGLFGVFVKRES